MFRNLLGYVKKRPKPQDIIKKWKIVKGDTVQVIRGKDKKKKGVVTKVLRDRNKLIVEGLNLVKKHVKPSEQQKGGILTKEAPIHYSNVALLDPNDGKPTKARWGFLPPTQRNVGEFSKKGRVRLSRRTNAIIPRPVTLGQRKKPKPKDGPKDTPAADVLEQTYVVPDYVESMKAKKAEEKLKKAAKRRARRLSIARRATEVKQKYESRSSRAIRSEAMAAVTARLEAKKAAAAKKAAKAGAAPPSSSSPPPPPSSPSSAPPPAGGGGGLPLGTIFTARPPKTPKGMRPMMENTD